MSQLQLSYLIECLQVIFGVAIGVQLFRMRESARKSDGTYTDVPTGLAMGMAALCVALAGIGALMRYTAEKQHERDRAAFESRILELQSKMISSQELSMKLQTDLGTQQALLAANDKARTARVHRQNVAMAIVTSIHEHDASIWKITALLRSGVIMNSAKIDCLVGSAVELPHEEITRHVLELCEFLRVSNQSLERLLAKQEESLMKATEKPISLVAELRSELARWAVQVETVTEQARQEQPLSSTQASGLCGDLLDGIAKLSAAAVADSRRATEQVLVWGNSD